MSDEPTKRVEFEINTTPEEFIQRLIEIFENMQDDTALPGEWTMTIEQDNKSKVISRRVVDGGKL